MLRSLKVLSLAAVAAVLLIPGQASAALTDLYDAGDVSGAMDTFTAAVSGNLGTAVTIAVAVYALFWSLKVFFKLGRARG